MSWEIVNIVATADLTQSVNLAELSKLPDAIYNPESYNGRVAYLKSSEMKSKVSIFSTGKLISAGSKQIGQAQVDLSYTAMILEKSGLINKVEVQSKIRNIVALAIFYISINLETLSEMIDAIYEPEQFPGIIFKPNEPKASFLIFQSGKTIISGINSVEKVESAFRFIEKTLIENSN